MNSYLKISFKAIACNQTSGEKKGGVAIFYMDSLPIIIRGDLSFDGCIVVELRFGRKKIFLQYCIEILCIKLAVLNFLTLLITLGTCTQRFLAIFLNLYR